MNFLGFTTPLLIDGGMATSLEARGVPMHPTLWSGGAVIDSPEKVTEVHAEFLRAGANVLITASYQLTPQALRKLGYDEKSIREILLRTVRCAESPCSERGRTLIAAGIGPYGAFLCDGSEYRGNYGIDQTALRDFHRERYEILAAYDCDLIVFETVPCLDEVRAIIELTRDAAPKPIWISVCCRNERELSSGESLAEAARLIASEPAVVAFGVNCVAPQFVSGHLQLLKEITSKAIFVYPNLGRVWDAELRTWSGGGDELAFLNAVDEWIALGADGIGGCCGVGSSLIHAIKRRFPDTGGNSV